MSVKEQVTVNPFLAVDVLTSGIVGTPVENSPMTISFRTRFAPSPTGFLHVGHAYAAQRAFEAARVSGGECLLRIEDIDLTRCRPEFETAIYEDLSWLGFSWQKPVRRQSDYLDEFQSALSKLQAMGLVYKCSMSRKAIQACLDDAGVSESPAGERPFRKAYAKNNVELTEGNTFAWRLSLDACRDHLGPQWQDLEFIEQGECRNYPSGRTKAHPEWMGDVILARKDAPTSYHLSVSHDDNVQGITHVVRGRDLYHSTHIHVLLQAVMGWPTPIYCHHELILGADGRKFSKSDASKTIRSLREEGVKPIDLLFGSGSPPA